MNTVMIVEIVKFVIILQILRFTQDDKSYGFYLPDYVMNPDNHW